MGINRRSIENCSGVIVRRNQILREKANRVRQVILTGREGGRVIEYILSIVNG